MKEHSAEFFISEDGRDWYKSQADFLPDTLKIAYDEAGIIRSISNDVSSIYPRGFSVVEVDITKANKSVDILVDGYSTTEKLSLVNIHKRNYAHKLKRINQNCFLPQHLLLHLCKMLSMKKWRRQKKSPCCRSGKNTG